MKLTSVEDAVATLTSIVVDSGHFAARCQAGGI